MKRQKIDNKKGEIIFRRKLYQQQIEGNKIFDDEFDAKEIESLLKDRMEKTLDQMLSLKKEGILLSPYLEIGAERGQRSLVLENDMGLQGISADISFEMLKSASHYQIVFGKEKIPLRLCCDANNLPIKSNSLPFVFCYETLHHFPDPTPAVNEAYRILSPGGHFFVEEEPYRQVLHLNLYRGEKIYSTKAKNQSKLKNLIDRFFKGQNCNEIDHGIIENHTNSIKKWVKAFSSFEDKIFTLKSVKSLEVDPSAFPLLKYFIAYLFGGSISGICKKQGQVEFVNSSETDQSSLFICPDCWSSKKIESDLEEKNNCLVCTNCKSQYPIVDGVVLLFDNSTLKSLYPEYAL
ncbi:MAG: methyltransferase domain-containing protein [Reichenbachiella sp.]